MSSVHVNYWAAPPPVVHTKAFHRSSNTPLVVVEVDDGVDAAWTGQQSITLGMQNAINLICWNVK